jgi:glycosyltransferase involved in cell wall biosynthesis
MKVLLSAYACQPDSGSEPGLGWNWARMLAREHEVWVLTRAANEPAISASAERPRVHWVFVPSPLRASHGSLIGWASHYLWQLAAYRRARTLHREIRFDIAHHVTLATWRLPCLLWRLGVPLVWGAVGGGQSIPPGFATVLGPSGRLREAIRTCFQFLSRYDPLVRQTLSRASAVIAANRPTYDLLVGLGRPDLHRLLETAITTQDRPTIDGRPTDGPLRILWVGALLPRKALPLLLGALAALSSGVAWRLDVVGDGRQRGRWQRIGRALGLTDRITFVGRVPHSEMPTLYRQADVFVFSSVRDTTGTVLLEAMAEGLPVIALAWSGTPEVVTEQCGIVIPPESPAQVIRELASALERLAASPDLRRRMGEAGRRRVDEMYSWETLAEEMRAIYREVVVDGRDGRPSGA